MSRPVTKLFLACTLLIATAFLPRSGQAVTCCYACATTYDACVANCHGSTTCNAGCSSRYKTCQRGCGPGGCGV
jgi:hypothetical protein